MNRGPIALLLALLGAHFVVIVSHSAHPLITDEFYFVAKGRHIAQYARFAPADPRAIAVEEGREYGTSDWRPPGYPLFLAAFGSRAFEEPGTTLRLRVTVVQFLGVAASLIGLLLLALRSGVSGVWRYGAAFIMGAPPWTFGFVSEIGPDALTVPLVTAALLMLGRYVTEPSPSAWQLVAPTFIASVALFFRPEMILLPPMIVGVAVALRTLRSRANIRPIVVAAVTWFALIGLQATYHTWHIGRPGVFGGQHIMNAGAFAWVNTWLGTEKEAYDFVYAVTEARPAPLPERAFDDERERSEVLALVARIRVRGLYLETDDTAFARLAAAKRRAHPVRIQLLRAWHATNMWFNVENNSPLLSALAGVPRSLRRPFYGAMVVLRLTIFLLAAAQVFVSTRALRRGEADAFDFIVLLMASYAVTRTLLTGVVLNWNVHRYVLSAWPPVLWCASMALRDVSLLTAREMWIGAGPSPEADTSTPARAAV